MPRSFYAAGAVLLLLLLPLLPARAAVEPAEQVIYSFSDCAGPTAPLITDGMGNLYGTATDGGSNKDGCVFELSPNPNGNWSEITLHTFSGTDGYYPSAALIFDKAGNLYGTTGGGGAYSGGVAYELSPVNSGWTETVLYNFGNGTDGFDPASNLVFDADGNLYGTTNSGGTHWGGTVYKLSPGQNGWTETVLYAFSNQVGGPDGDSPVGGVVMDKSGSLYGVTAFGGVNGYGAVYRVTPKSGTYVEQIIHSFNGYDGLEPTSGLAAHSGNLYGTTSSGGSVGYGTVYKLTRGINGKWTESVLHSLDDKDGGYALGPVVFDRAGNLYAAAMTGGQYEFGTVFKLTPNSNGFWTDTVLHTFYFGSDGRSPYAGVTLSRERLFGTTYTGGAYDEGTVFSISPPNPD
jgi:uncharacterized repeat protein (TIGR03803 family)